MNVALADFRKNQYVFGGFGWRGRTLHPLIHCTIIKGSLLGAFTKKL